MGQQAALEREKTSAERAEAWEKVQEGKVKVVCNSQKHAEGFYGKLGWVSEGEDFLEVSEDLGAGLREAALNSTDNYLSSRRDNRM